MWHYPQYCKCSIRHQHQWCQKSFLLPSACYHPQLMSAGTTRSSLLLASHKQLRLSMLSPHHALPLILLHLTVRFLQLFDAPF